MNISRQPNRFRLAIAALAVTCVAAVGLSTGSASAYIAPTLVVAGYNAHVTFDACRDLRHYVVASGAACQSWRIKSVTLSGTHVVAGTTQPWSITQAWSSWPIGTSSVLYWASQTPVPADACAIAVVKATYYDTVTRTTRSEGTPTLIKLATGC